MKVTREESFLLTQEQYDFIMKGGLTESYNPSYDEKSIYLSSVDKINSFTKYFEYIASKVMKLEGDDIIEFVDIAYLNYIENFKKIDHSLHEKQIIQYITTSCIWNYHKDPSIQPDKILYEHMSLDNYLDESNHSMTFLDVVSSNIPGPIQQYEIDLVSEFYKNHVRKHYPILYMQTQTGAKQRQIAEEIGCTHQNVSRKLLQEKHDARQDVLNRNLDLSSTKNPEPEILRVK